MGDDKKPADPKKDEKKPPPTLKQSVATMPAWKKTALILAGIVMAIGLGMQLFASSTREEPPATPASAAGAESTGARSGAFTPQGFAPTDGGGVDDEPLDPEAQAEVDRQALEDASAMDVYSPAIFRMGFSFFAALAIAHALRTLLKATVIGIGFLLLGLLALEYAGFVTVNWTVIESRYESFGAWAGDQFASFRTFVDGALPSVGSAAVGAVLGFKRT